MDRSFARIDRGMNERRDLTVIPFSLLFCQRLERVFLGTALYPLAILVTEDSMEKKKERERKGFNLRE